MINKNCLDSLCGALAYAIGAQAPKQSAPPLKDLTALIDEKLKGEKVQRIFMYNPDAIGQWVYEKYTAMFEPITAVSDISIPLATVMPSVTPVCFGTMYTGAMPQIHGIQSYNKPVIAIDTIFDALIRSGKKPAIISTVGDSMSKIYLNRNMDYFFYNTVEEVNQKAEELILDYRYDFLAVYNGNYDTAMHKFGPESKEALAELKLNIKAFNRFRKLIEENWKGKSTLLGFAMDHGCHEIDGGCGSHGLAMEEDLNIVHLYSIIK